MSSRSTVISTTGLAQNATVAKDATVEKTPTTSELPGAWGISATTNASVNVYGSWVPIVTSIVAPLRGLLVSMRDNSLNSAQGHIRIGVGPASTEVPKLEWGYQEQSALNVVTWFVLLGAPVGSRISVSIKRNVAGAKTQDFTFTLLED